MECDANIFWWTFAKTDIVHLFTSVKQAAERTGGEAFENKMYMTHIACTVMSWNKFI